MLLWGKNKEKARPFTNIKVILRNKKRAGWWHSERYAEVEAAHDWGIDMDRWWELSEAAKAYMMTYTDTQGWMRAWEEHLAERESKKRA